MHYEYAGCETREITIYYNIYAKCIVKVEKILKICIKILLKNEYKWYIIYVT